MNSDLKSFLKFYAIYILKNGDTVISIADVFENYINIRSSQYSHSIRVLSPEPVKLAGR